MCPLTIKLPPGPLSEWATHRTSPCAVVDDQGGASNLPSPTNGSATSESPAKNANLKTKMTTGDAMQRREKEQVTHSRAHHHCYEQPVPA